MGLETATYINDLVASNPPASDPTQQGDDHLRLIKAALKNTFPGSTSARYLEQARADLASATSTDLGTPTTNYINITGTTQIESFATEVAGVQRLLRFDDALTLKHSAALSLPTSADILTEAGDHAMAISLGVGDWLIPAYFRASGAILANPFPTISSGDVGKFLQATDDDPQARAWTSIFQTFIGMVAINPHPSGTLPSDGTWLHCNGQAVSRATYADLFAFLDVAYGNGDGSTTFNLPDYRGQFLRGWANGTTIDPDKASRTNRGDGTTGDAVGTKQSSQYTLHGHPYRISQNDGIGSPGGFMTNSGNEGNFAAYTGTPSTIDGQQIGGSGGNETRPVNINVMYIIKAKAF